MKIFGSLLAGLALAAACSQAHALKEADASAAIVETATLDERPLLWGAQRQAGDVLFAGAGDSASVNDIVSIELGSGRKRVLARGISGGRFMARDSRFIVIAQPERGSVRLILFSATGGERLAEATIENAIEWAGILRDRLVVIQQGDRQPGTTAIVLDLPGLKRLKAITVSRISGAAVWKDNVILLGKTLEYFDRDMKSRTIVDIPPTPPLPGHGCHDGPLRVDGDRAVAVLGCGYIHVFDLAARRHKFVIPRYADSYGIDVARDLIFTTPAYWVNFRQRGPGLRSAHRPRAGVVPVRRRSVVCIRRGTRGPDHRAFAAATIHSVSIRRGGTPRWTLANCARHRRVRGSTRERDRRRSCGGHRPLRGCRHPERAARGVAPSPLAPYAREYAHWLSVALDRRQEALDALDAVRSPVPDAELTGWSEELRLKQILLDRSSDLPVTAAPRHGSFSEKFSRGSQLFASTPIPLRFGMWPNLLQFDGDRAYVARWGCDGSSNDCKDDKHYLDVLDQSTFRLIRSVEVKGLETDDNYISSVAVLGKRIYVMAAYRYEHEPRPNLFTYDAETLEQRATGTLPIDRRLVVREGNLLACACGTEGGQACLNVHPETLEYGEAPSWSCVGAGDDSQVLRTPVGTAALATPNYFVSPLPYSRRENGFEFLCVTRRVPRRRNRGC